MSFAIKKKHNEFEWLHILRIENSNLGCGQRERPCWTAGPSKRPRIG